MLSASRSYMLTFGASGFSNEDRQPNGVGRYLQLHFARQSPPTAEASLLQLPAALRLLYNRLEPTASVQNCLASIDGTRLSDVLHLRALGLAEWVPAPIWGAREVVQQACDELIAELMRSTSDRLYPLLTRHAKELLGLLQGFQTILALERCDGDTQYQALALKFLGDVWHARGAAGIERLHASVCRSS